MPNIQPQITKCLLLSFVPPLRPTSALVEWVFLLQACYLALQVCLPGISFKARKKERNEGRKKGREEGEKKREEEGRGYVFHHLSNDGLSLNGHGLNERTRYEATFAPSTDNSTPIPVTGFV